MPTDRAIASDDEFIDERQPTRHQRLGAIPLAAESVTFLPPPVENPVKAGGAADGTDGATAAGIAATEEAASSPSSRFAAAAAKRSAEMCTSFREPVLKPESVRDALAAVRRSWSVSVGGSSALAPSARGAADAGGGTRRGSAMALGGGGERSGGTPPLRLSTS